MMKIVKTYKNLPINKKMILIGSFIIICTLLVVAIPSLARFDNRNTLYSSSVWDGTTASKYRSGTGTISDPYVIANGSELAFFGEELKTKTYQDTYFVLNNDIVLNDGLFNYSKEEGITYTYEGKKYFVDDKTGKYYTSINKSGSYSGIVNLFSSLDNFKGHLDGKHHRIYGTMISNLKSQKVGLFTNLNADINDLYVENSIINGGIVTGGIASNMNNTNIDNVMFEGNVINNQTLASKEVTTTVADKAIEINDYNVIDTTTLTPPEIPENATLVSAKLTGKYKVIDNDAVFVSSDTGILENGEFTFDLTNDDLYSLNLTISSLETIGTVELTDVVYTKVYDESVVGGISGTASNTNLLNTIVKGGIYSSNIAGGMFGNFENLINIDSSYNNAYVSTVIGGGIVGLNINDTYTIDVVDSYNTGLINGGKTGGIAASLTGVNSTASFEKVFDTSDTNFAFNTVELENSSFINVFYTSGRAHDTSVATTTPVLISKSNLIDKDYMTTTLLFNEFISYDDVNNDAKNKWIFDGENLPVIYIDDVISPIASIHAGYYKWNNFAKNLDTITTSKEFSFTIKPTDELEVLKEISYYVSTTELTTEELEPLLIPYVDVVTLSEEGEYIIYAKVVDNNDQVTYINSDILQIDFMNKSHEIKVGNYSYDEYVESNKYQYFDDIINVNIRTDDQLSNNGDIKYYISNTMMTLEELKNLEDSNFATYTDTITLDTMGTYVVYARIGNDASNYIYMNTDYLVYDGYTTNVSLGRNKNSYSKTYSKVSNDSIIRVDLAYNNEKEVDNTDIHNFVSNILLPVDTKITMIDNITGKVYTYEVSTDEDLYGYTSSCKNMGPSCENVAKYPLTLFKEIGTAVMSIPYEEQTYYTDGIVNEDFTFLVDFKNTNITDNYDETKFYMDLTNKDDKTVRPALNTSLKTIDIKMGNNESSVILETQNINQEIVINSESTTTIPLSINTNYKEDILNTNLEDKKYGIAIKVVDSNNKIVSKEHLKEIKFTFNNNSFGIANDNIARINLGSGLNQINGNLVINTTGVNTNLSDGSYKFIISTYTSSDGFFYTKTNNEEITIQARVSNNYSNINYSFDCLTNDSIINKTSENDNIFNYDIIQKTELANSTLRVSLYKKDQLTAYNQDYSVIDLNKYITNDLVKHSDNVYIGLDNLLEYDETDKSINKFSLNFDKNTLDKGGYKVVFDLYSDNKKIGTINKYFIVK